MPRRDMVNKAWMMLSGCDVVKLLAMLAASLLVLTVSCSTPPPASKSESADNSTVLAEQPLAIPVQSADGLEEQETVSPAVGSDEKSLSEVAVSRSSFNPTAGQSVSISYVLLDKADVQVNIHDPDSTLVRTLEPKRSQASGRHSVTWDGKDQDGTVVPDEAYFFTITTKSSQGKTQAYDPTSFSGGDSRDIVKADIDPITKAITYKLPEMSRVLIRLGVQDGPLLNTLVDWKPRVAGQITEHWTGRDKDGVVDLLNHPRFKMLITCFALPENSVITYGNGDQDYRTYMKSMAGSRVVKERPARSGVVVSPHYQLSRTVDYSPRLEMTFPGIEGAELEGIPVLSDKALVKVDINEEDRSYFVNQQYEITFFLDTEFYTEQEIGHAPFNWVWDLSDVEEGEHVLTVNMSGFKDQIGVLSKRVKVIK